MAKHIGNRIVRFIKYTDLDGNPISDWHDEYLDTTGLLCIYESEHKAPGKKFVYYYPNEPDAPMQRYFNSVSGELTESDNMIQLDEVHRYVFEVGDYITEDDLMLLKLNVFARL